MFISISTIKGIDYDVDKSRIVGLRRHLAETNPLYSQWSVFVEGFGLIDISKDEYAKINNLLYKDNV